MIFKNRKRTITLLFMLVLFIVGGYVGIRLFSWARSNSMPVIIAWFSNRENRSALTTELTEPCPDAPFLLPTSGLIGLIYADSAAPYTILRRHTGIDIFGDGTPGEIPIVAVYDGYLSRYESWRSTVIIRHEDPLQEGRTIWTYYTHMANASGTVDFIHEDFPRGTSDKFVEQGQIIGYQGDYGGNRAVGLHLHMSIVTTNPDGTFKNESVLANTLDPSPYFGMELDARKRPHRPIGCNPS